MASTVEIKNVAELKEHAKKQYLKAKWPSLQDEEWRRSDPAALPFNILEEQTDNAVQEHLQETIEVAITSHAEANKFIYTTFDTNDNTDITNILGQALEHSLDRLDIWRLMQLRTGVGIIVPDGVTIENPVELVLSGTSAETVYAPVFVFILGKNSSIKTSLVIKGDGIFLPSIITSVGAYATYHACDFQNSSIDSVVVATNFTVCQENANIHKMSAQLGGMIANSRSYVRIDGSRANVNMNGSYFANEDQLIDVRTYQSHIAQNSYSRVIYNGVAIDEAHTVYRGLIEVDHNAEETDAYLTNKNILLSEDARMDSIPCLNINTNEVRCSHGSTTGTLDKNHVFYLQSRGLSLQEAQNLLIESFLESVLNPHFSQLNKDILQSLQDKIESIKE